jgi:hypothetical protein
MQHAVNITIEEAVFSMWFAYFHCWATDVSYNGPPRECISSPVVEREQEWNESSAVKEEGFG